jgi:hypothetical protein
MKTKTLRSIDVTDTMIATLKDEADAAGDVKMARDCRDANVNANAFRRVLKALRNARAMAD